MGTCVLVPSQPSPPYDGRVESYPVREAGPFVWIWMGDPGRARRQPLPALPWLDPGSGWAGSRATLDVSANYMLIHEHYPDLTHIPWVHPQETPPTLGHVPPLDEIGVSEAAITVSRKMPLAPLADWEAVATGLPPEADYRRRHHGSFISPAVLADVRDPDAVAAALEKAANDIGPVSAVVAGAAGNFMAPAESMSSKGFRTVLDIDLVGSFHTAHAAFEQLKQTRGSILFVSAGQSDSAYLHQAHVGAAKAGIDSLMRHLAAEWGPLGIRSNAMVPGPIDGTEGMKRLAAQVGRRAWTDGIALGRYGTADEVGAMAVVLASPLASYVTGARIVVDGGLALSGSGLVNRALIESVHGQHGDR